MKKLCFVIPSLEPGGMERVMSELISYFSGKPDVDLHVILYGSKRDIFYELPLKNIMVHKPEWEFDISRRLYFTIKTFFYLRRVIKKLNPVSVLSFGEYWNSFVLLALYGMDLPVYVSDRCQPDKKLGSYHDTLRKLLYPTAKGVVAQTKTAKKIYKNKFNHNNVRVIGNPIREICFCQKGSIEEKIVLTVGRLIESKHHDRLIRIFKNIDAPDWKLVIVGGDALKQNGKDKLKKLIFELGMENKVKLTGTVSSVEEYYQKSKIFAFTSSSEGFPNVVGEAMSACLPVIAYDCVAGPSDLIDDGINGFLIPLFDDQRFEQKLKFLMTDQKLRGNMGKAAARKIKQFSIPDIGNKYYEFITEHI